MYWMLWTLIGVLLAALCIMIVELIRYRRQIQEICRQLAFHGREKSNQEIRIQVRMSEIQELQEKINCYIRQCRAWEAEYKNADEALKNMITNISHDIRTPLTSVDGYFQLLCMASEEDEKQKYIEIISGRLQSLSSILEQLFTYVRVQNSTFQANLEKHDVKQLLCENLFSFYEEFKRRGIEPKVLLPEEVCFAQLDPVLFERVLQNVLKNAFVHGNMEIIICLTHIESKISLQIKNNTFEKHSEIPELVFERFYQGDENRDNRTSGLGLCISKELVEKMNGSIRAFYEEHYFGIEIIFAEEG